MKQFEPKNVEVNGYNFYIYPFPAFKAANMSGELFSVLGPALGSIASLLGGEGENEGSKLLDIDVEKSAPAIAGAFSSVNGDKIEALLRKLLVSGRNIAVELEKGGDAEYLSEDALNSIFCGATEGMFVLAFHVIKANFGGFFKKFENLSGLVAKKLKVTETQINTEG
jgi:hypothetical protein